MLLLRTIAKFGFSDRPWISTEIPVGVIVKFVRTIKPKISAHSQCYYHGHGSNKCRHIVIEWDGIEVPTSICMEDAALHYFVEVKTQNEQS